MKIIETSFVWRGELSTRTVTKYIALHHAEASKCTVDDIDTWHKANGWSGIGYHFFVRKDGSIYRGRPLWSIGAHVLGMNNCSIGICAEGDYMKETMPDAQKHSIAELIDYLKKNYYPSARIVGHREIGDSECPGTRYPLNELKNYKMILNEDSIEPYWADEYLNKLISRGAISNKEIWSDYKSFVRKCDAIALIDKLSGGTWTSNESDTSIHWVQPYVISMCGKGVIDSKEIWLNDPEAWISKGQLLAIINKMKGGVLDKYKNSQDDHWARKHLNSLCDKGIITTPSAWTDFDGTVNRENFMALVCKSILG